MTKTSYNIKMSTKQQSTLKIICCILLTLSLLLGTAAPALADEQAPVLQLAENARQTLVEFLDEEYDYYFRYYTAEELKETTNSYKGIFGGVGIVMQQNDEKNIVVNRVMTGTPAERSGQIAAGDIILSVDGQSVLKTTPSDASLLIRGEIGTSVSMKFQRTDGTIYDVLLERAEIADTSMTGQVISWLDNTIYVLIYEFTGQTLSDFIALYNELLQETAIDSIIFDLRSNIGGNFPTTINLANYFVPAGHTIVSEKTADGIKTYTSNLGSLNSVNIYVLQNSWSASASEVLIGALKDEAGAVLFGTTSYGKGITQRVVGIGTEGAGLSYTQSRYFTPSGYDLHDIGIEADVIVETPDGITSADYFSTDPARNPFMAAVRDYINSQN